MQPDPASGLTAADIRFIVTGQNGNTGAIEETPAAVNFGNNTTITASVYAPNGTLNIGQNAHATGAFLARWVTIANNVTLTLESGW